MHINDIRIMSNTEAQNRLFGNVDENVFKSLNVNDTQ